MRPMIPDELDDTATACAADDGPASDGRLLEQFRTQRDEAAFAALVERHGPMVLAVCRRVLRHTHDAEDAFQATFLVLARKARDVGKEASVGSWLYKVAYRLALRARDDAARRLAREARAARPDDVPADETHVWRELEPLLDEEVSRLPEKYRTPFVLCYLQGKTYDEIAQELVCPKGTVSIRLTRARQRLRDRLVRRGVVLSAAVLAGAAATGPALAAVPGPLWQTTLRAAALFAANKTAATRLLAARASALAEGELRSMWWSKTKVVALVLVCCGLLGAGILTTFSRGADDQAAQKKAAVDKLEGTWRIVRHEDGLGNPPEELLKGMKLVVTATKVQLVQNGKVHYEAGYRIDPSKMPKEIDLIEKENDRELSHLGIYEIKGDTLRICKSHPPGARPTAFAVKQGEHWPLLLEFKRE